MIPFLLPLFSFFFPYNLCVMKICTLNMMVDLIRLFSGSYSFLFFMMQNNTVSSFFIHQFFFFIRFFFLFYINVFFLVIAHNLTSFLLTHHNPTHHFHSHLSKECIKKATQKNDGIRRQGISNSSSVANIYQLYPNRGFEKASNI